MQIRLAQAADLTDLIDLIHLKAGFDGCPNAVTATAEKLEATLFSRQPMAYVLLVEVSSPADPSQTAPVGFASYHFTYSTFLAQPSIWLDDLFIKREYRNQAIGTQLIQTLCKIAQDRGCGRIEWTVDVDNAAGIRFYQRQGARLQTQVHLCRLNQTAIQSAVQSATQVPA